MTFSLFNMCARGITGFASPAAAVAPAAPAAARPGESSRATHYFDRRTTKSGVGGCPPNVTAYSEFPNSAIVVGILSAGLDANGSVMYRVTKPDRWSGDSSTTATRLREGCGDVQRPAVEQQAIAVANGAATREITAGDIDRNGCQRVRIEQVQLPLAHVNDDQVLSIRRGSDAVGSGRRSRVQPPRTPKLAGRGITSAAPGWPSGSRATRYRNGRVVSVK